MNLLTARQRERILERLRRGDSLRKIESETGHRRETVARVGRLAGLIPCEHPPLDPAERRMATSRCEPFRAFIENAVQHGVSARTIHRRLVESYGYDGAYNSVKRFIRTLRPRATADGTVLAFAQARRRRKLEGTALCVAA